jgi:hypothetical protein
MKVSIFSFPCSPFFSLALHDLKRRRKAEKKEETKAYLFFLQTHMHIICIWRRREEEKKHCFCFEKKIYSMLVLFNEGRKEGREKGRKGKSHEKCKTSEMNDASQARSISLKRS